MVRSSNEYRYFVPLLTRLAFNIPIMHKRVTRLSVRQNVFYPVWLSLLNPRCKQFVSSQNNASGHFFLFHFVIAALNEYVIVASIIVIRDSINCAALF